MILAAIGVCGLVSQAVNQRAREVSIRLALGATPREVIAAVVSRALVVAVVGVLLGGLGALALGNGLQALLYGVRARDTASFVTAAAALLITTVCAALLPALRVTRIDASETLRSE